MFEVTGPANASKHPQKRSALVRSADRFTPSKPSLAAGNWLSYSYTKSSAMLAVSDGISVPILSYKVLAWR